MKEVIIRITEIDGNINIDIDGNGGFDKSELIKALNQTIKMLRDQIEY